MTYQCFWRRSNNPDSLLLRVVSGILVSVVSGGFVVVMASCLLAYLSDLVEASLCALAELVALTALLVWCGCISGWFVYIMNPRFCFNYLVESFEGWVVV